MSRTTLKQQWQEFQQDRVRKIHTWYHEHYSNAQVHDFSVKYIVLWSIFNALYNIYDLPNNKLEKKDGRYRFKMKIGFKVPDIHVSGDFKRIIKFAEKLVSIDGFTNLINQPDMKRRIKFFVDRVPSVAQREEVDPGRVIQIVLKDKNNKDVEDEFSPATIRGISSLDRRLFLTDGYKFFEYAVIEPPWNEKGNLIDLDATTKQLLNVLYQLRNNVVHGGVVSHKRKSIINDALPILQRIVEFVFANADQIYTGEKD